MNVDQVLTLLQTYPLVDDETFYPYGTAGFRFKVECMDGILLRVGIVSAILLSQQPDGEDMGLMVTASHNDESYNGVKLSNPDGSMISPDQEKLLVQWVNERNLQQWKEYLSTTIMTNTTTTTTSSTNAVFHVGRDTRSHSERLTDLAIQGANAMGATVQNHGILTTPMLHSIVLHSNPKYLLGSSIEPSPSRLGYIQAMTESYLQLVQAIVPSPSKDEDKSNNDDDNNNNNNNKTPPLYVDCACGVGYDAVQQVVQTILLMKEEEEMTAATRVIIPQNKPGDGPLNITCGSEHVQKQLKPPTWYSNEANKQMERNYCCSLDGDADRIVFFSSAKDHELTTLLDGDKIAVLIAHFIKKELNQLYAANNTLPKITMGVVQTAYANGASTLYLQETLKVPVVVTKTGVKHLHHAAMEFDVGVYFEANGHGTVLFSEKYHQLVESTNNTSLQLLPRLINPAVGDALSDLLLVDALLQHLEWSLEDWNSNLYKDLPSRQLKVKVKDRSIVKCNSNETKCISPETLQPALELAMKDIPGSRTFCRASGTENVVRIYAEAPTRVEADQLAIIAAALVHEHCDGVGPLPSI